MSDPKTIDGRYEVLRRLGKGGFGEVYLVRDMKYRGELRALKVLRPPSGNQEEFESRFLNEIGILRELSHPGIPRIYNDGTAEGEVYYTMAYVDGVTLSTVLKQLHSEGKRLDPERIVTLLRRILEILNYAHGKGVVHRDLKPANIMLVNAGTPEEDVRVLDFGIAKVLRGGAGGIDLPTMGTMAGMGTPHYMSPEQVRGKDVDARTDVYALGVILYQMCSGRLPFEGESDLQIATARLEEDPKPLNDPATPAWMRDLVRDLLRRAKTERPTVRELATRLETHGVESARGQATSTAASGARATSDARPTAAEARHVPRGFLTIGIPVLLVLAGLGVGWAVFGRANSDAGRDDLVSKAENEADPARRTNATSEGPGTRGPESPAGGKNARADTDGDGVLDVDDECPNDPKKVRPGACGCGKPDVDTDGDGVLDCKDECPNDARKSVAGQCGCGKPDVDSDGDGVADCKDECPTDAAKTAPGLCGCGKPDVDTDRDGTPDCQDGCPNDAAKVAPGLCGCGKADTDRDGDGTPDCKDGCPDDPKKTEPGAAGCGRVEGPAAPGWATVLQAAVDPNVVTSAALRGKLVATGLPWRVRDRASGIEMVLIPPDTYARGASPKDSAADEDEKPAHQVQLARALYVGRYEVQESEWAHVMSDGAESGTLGLPKSEVSHEDALQFLEKLQAKSPKGASPPRLLTEAEWEYVCRAGSTTSRYAPLESSAWFADDSGGNIHDVGGRVANALGCVDMLGNLWEWCADWYDDAEYGRCANGVQNPKGPDAGEFRVVRGGYWNSSAHACRASERRGFPPDLRTDFVGLRVCRAP